MNLPVGIIDIFPVVILVCLYSQLALKSTLPILYTWLRFNCHYNVSLLSLSEAYVTSHMLKRTDVRMRAKRTDSIANSHCYLIKFHFLIYKCCFI